MTAESLCLRELGQSVPFFGKFWQGLHGICKASDIVRRVIQLCLTDSPLTQNSWGSKGVQKVLTGQLASLLTYGKINTRWHAQGKDLKTLILTLIVILTFHICPGPQGELSFLYLSQGKDTFVLFYSNPPSGKSLQTSIDVFVSGEYPRTCYLPGPHTFHVLPSQQCVPGPAPLAHGTRGIPHPKLSPPFLVCHLQNFVVDVFSVFSRHTVQQFFLWLPTVLGAPLFVRVFSSGVIIAHLWAAPELWVQNFEQWGTEMVHQFPISVNPPVKCHWQIKLKLHTVATWLKRRPFLPDRLPLSLQGLASVTWDHLAWDAKPLLSLVSEGIQNLSVSCFKHKGESMEFHFFVCVLLPLKAITNEGN